eukprot:6866024-Pyramimonas_sp.AAC.1
MADATHPNCSLAYHSAFKPTPGQAESNVSAAKIALRFETVEVREPEISKTGCRVPRTSPQLNSRSIFAPGEGSSESPFFALGTTTRREVLRDRAGLLSRRHTSFTLDDSVARPARLIRMCDPMFRNTSTLN